MPRLSITLTDSQAEALDRIAATTGASKQSMIGLAISEWLAEHDTPQRWYGWVQVSGPDPLSGAPTSWQEGTDAFATKEEAVEYATRAAASALEDADLTGITAAVPMVGRE